VVYADKLAGGLPTVCKGITKWASPYPVVVGERWLLDAKLDLLIPTAAVFIVAVLLNI